MKVLLGLKAQYKSATGKDWKPDSGAVKTTEVKQTASQSKDVDDLNNRITEQGTTVRGLKEKKAAKVSEYA